MDLGRDKRQNKDQTSMTQISVKRYKTKKRKYMQPTPKAKQAVLTTPIKAYEGMSQKLHNMGDTKIPANL